MFIVLTFVAAAISAFFMIVWTNRAWVSYFVTVILGNSIVMGHDFYNTGYISGWWMIGHFFLTLVILLGSFFGHMGWVLYEFRGHNT